MLLLHEPDRAEITRLAERAASLPLSSQPDLLAHLDAGRRPRGWFVDKVHAEIGHGVEAFVRARDAIAALVPFDQSWLRVHGPGGVAMGVPIGVEVHVGPLRSVNWCRVTRIIDGEDRYGFEYATTTDHGERGAERFEVRMVDGAVVYEITAVSRPNAWYTMVVQPYVRRLQARFRRGSVAAMRGAVGSPKQEDSTATPGS